MPIMFELFTLRLALGLLLGLAVLPVGVVSSRFYRIQLLIVQALVLTAAALAWESAGDLFWIGTGVALGACLVGAVSWSVESPLAGYVSLATSGLALLAALGDLTSPAGGIAPGGVWLLLESIASAALLGLTTTAMLMGHWYLIAPTLSLQPLLRLLRGFFVALGLRMLMAGSGLALALGFGGPGASSLDRVAWLWLGTHWLVGLVGLAVLGWMAWRCARIRSTQSATGILYVGVVCCFLGELTGQLLSGHLANPFIVSGLE